jgi:hypothetical protein
MIIDLGILDEPKKIRGKPTRLPAVVSSNPNIKAR